MKYFEKTLDNGLRIVGEQRENAKSTAAGFFVKAGARDETEEVNGVSHFLEHMMFKGTDKRSALDISFELGRIGAQANAFTSEENTVYYATVLPEFKRDLIELLSDMMKPKLDPTEFATEKNVILEEIEMYQDRPTHVLFENSMIKFFGDCGAGKSVLGSSDSITKLSVEQMHEYFTARYSPNNMTFAIAGDFDFAEIEDYVSELCSEWKSQEVDRKYIPREKNFDAHSLEKSDLSKSHVCLLCDGPSFQDDLKYSAQVFGCILGDGSGSRSYWEIIDKGLADSASIGIDCMDQTGLIYGYLSSDGDKFESSTELFKKIIQEHAPVSDGELERAKTKIKTRFVLQGESSLRRAMSIGLGSNYQVDYMPLDDEIAKIEAVSKKSIAELLEKFPTDKLAEVRLLPS